MSEKNTMVDLEKEVSFTYPEGFAEALQVLDFIPEEERIGVLAGFLGSALQL